jgi:hypothetical protein
MADTVKDENTENSEAGKTEVGIEEVTNTEVETVENSETEETEVEIEETTATE